MIFCLQFALLLACSWHCSLVCCLTLIFSIRHIIDGLGCCARAHVHLVQRIVESGEFDFIPLKRAAWYLVTKPNAALRFGRQKHVDKIRVFVDSDFAVDPVSRKITTALVAQIDCEIWINASDLDSIARWRSKIFRSGERRSSWSIPDIYAPRSRNSRIDQEQDSERSTLKRGTTENKNESKTESPKKAPTAKNRADVGTKPVLCFRTTTKNASFQDWYSADHGSYKMKGDCRSGTHKDPESKAQKQTIVSVDREHQNDHVS